VNKLENILFGPSNVVVGDRGARDIPKTKVPSEGWPLVETVTVSANKRTLMRRSPRSQACTVRVVFKSRRPVGVVYRESRDGRVLS